MPRTGQIIPPYYSPHEAVYINDNTIVEDAAVENTGVRFGSVFIGDSPFIISCLFLLVCLSLSLYFDSYLF